MSTTQFVESTRKILIPVFCDCHRADSRKRRVRLNQGSVRAALAGELHQTDAVSAVGKKNLAMNSASQGWFAQECETARFVPQSSPSQARSDPMSFFVL